MDIVDALEEAGDADFTMETEKAWEAMHRALTDGSLDTTAGEYPLNRAILGGEQFHEGDGYIVALVTKEDVPAVARALATIDERAFRERYHRLAKGYAPEHDDWWYALHWASPPPEDAAQFGGPIYWRGRSPRVAYCWKCHDDYVNSLGGLVPSSLLPR